MTNEEKIWLKIKFLLDKINNLDYDEYTEIKHKFRSFNKSKKKLKDAWEIGKGMEEAMRQFLLQCNKVHKILKDNDNRRKTKTSPTT